MKHFIILTIIFTGSISIVPAQVGIGTSSPDPSAALDISSDTAGLLIPQMTTAQIELIQNPADGLQVYNTEDGCLYIYARGDWQSMCGFSRPDSIVPPTGQTTGAWTQIGNFGGGARFGSCGFTINGKGYLGLGVANGTQTVDIWEYDPADDSWTQMPDFPGSQRCMAIGVTIGDKAYVGLGQASGNEYDDFYMFDPDSAVVWTQLADYPGLGGNRCIAFAIDGILYVGMGLATPMIDDVVYKDFWQYVPAANTWTQLTDFPGPARYSSMAFSVGGKGYVATGGEETGGGDYFLDVWEYDPMSDTWTQLSEYPGPATRHGMGFTIGGYGFAGTGWHNFELGKDFWRFDPAMGKWNSIPQMGPLGRYHAAGFVIGNTIYAGTGLLSNQPTGTNAVATANFWRYDAEAIPQTLGVYSDGTSQWQPGLWAAAGDHLFNTTCGNVGIGTGDPAEKLTVYNGNVGIDKGELILTGNQFGVGYITGIEFHNIDSTKSDPAPFRRQVATISANRPDQAVNGRLHFSTRGGTGQLPPLVLRMVIDENGNIGMGESNPTERLHLNGSLRMVDGNQASGRVLTSDTDGVGSWQRLNSLLDDDGDTRVIVQDSNQIHFETNGSVNMVIDENGNVGMGESNPTERLHLNGSLRMVDGSQSSGRVLTSDMNGVGSWQRQSSLVDDDGDTRVIVQNSDQIHFETNGSVSMLIDQFGRWNNDGSAFNLAVGSGAGIGVDHNTSIGVLSGQALSTGTYNVGLGAEALYSTTSAYGNTALGAAALRTNQTGTGNVAIGANAGFLSTGSGNIFIGTDAGFNETGSNKLYIENSDSATPLIYGEFNNNLVRINGNLEVTGTSNMAVPIGTVVMWPNNTPPAGWLICNGAAVPNLNVDYPELFAVLGTNVLPDFNGRFPVGVGNSGTTGSTPLSLGGAGGEAQHHLTTDEMPSHTHNVTITFREGDENGSGNDYSDLNDPSPNANHVYTTTSAGGNAPHENMPPYFVINFIIKAE